MSVGREVCDDIQRAEIMNMGLGTTCLMLEAEHEGCNYREWVSTQGEFLSIMILYSSER